MVDEQAAESSLQPAPGPTILVIDDNRASRELLSSMLRKIVSVTVAEAHTGEKGLELALQLKPCLTFLDFDMPDKDGLAVLKELREAQPQAFVVMVTAHSGAAVVDAALGLQIQGFIIKPYSPQRIVDTMKRYVALTRDVSIFRSRALS